MDSFSMGMPAAARQRFVRLERPLARSLDCMVSSKFSNEPVLDFFSRPWSFAQKREAGFYRRIELKTANGDSTPHFAPAMPLNQLIENALQSNAVQRVAGMGDGCRHKIYFGQIFRIASRCFNYKRFGIKIQRDCAIHPQSRPCLRCPDRNKFPTGSALSRVQLWLRPRMSPAKIPGSPCRPLGFPNLCSFVP